MELKSAARTATTTSAAERSRRPFAARDLQHARHDSQAQQRSLPALLAQGQPAHGQTAQPRHVRHSSSRGTTRARSPVLQAALTPVTTERKRATASRKWSAGVTRRSDALDLEPSVFKSRSAAKIAASL